MRPVMGALICGGAVCASPALAQQQVEPAAAVAASQSQPEAPGEEIVVTGRREPLYRIEDVTAGALGARDVLDIPFSITAFGQNLIKAQRVTTLNELLRNDPSVQNFNFGGNYDYIAIRGFETSTASSFRRDGLQTITLTDIPFENKERVEVLKGVSGFLFGFAEPGGTINYVIKRPAADPFLFLDAEVRDNEGVYGHLDAGGPIPGTTLGVRVNVAGEKVGDFTRNRDLERYLLAGALDWRPLPALTLRFDAEHQYKELAAQPQIPLTTAGTIIEGFDPDTLLGVPWLRYETWATSFGFRADYDLARGWTVTSQWNYADLERNAAFPFITSLEPNGDYVGVPLLGPKETQNSQGYSQQTFVSGEFATGPLAHRLIAGIYTADSDAVFCGYAPDGPPYQSNIFNPVYPPPVDLGDVPPGRSCPQTNEQFHVFASDSVSVGPFELIAGARYVDYRYASTGRFVATYADDVLTPSVALLFKPAERVRLYASYAENLQEGGVAPNEPDVVNAGEALPPLKADQYEIGAKAEVLAGLNLTFAAFRISKPADYVDPATRIFGRFGLQRHQGIEFTAAGQPTRHLSLVAGFMLLDAALTRNADPALDGNRPYNVPEFQANAFVDYSLPWLPGLALNAGIFHVGARAFDTENSLFVDGHTRLDLGARYAFRAGGTPLVLRLNIDNVTDEFYWESIAYGGLTAGVPRTFRLSAQVEF